MRGLTSSIEARNRQLEYDLVVAAHSHPETIRLSIGGVQKLSTDTDGDLILRTRSGAIRQRKPFAYQELGSMKQPVPCRYALMGRHQVGFVVGNYDINRPLIIDPVLDYSIVGEVAGGVVAADASGNAYIFSGSTVNKLNAQGTALVYSTSVGPLRSGGGIAVDSSGNAHITGAAYSGFPLVNPLRTYIGGLGCGSHGNDICPDAIVAKLNSTGSALIYSTYLGGTGNDEGNSIAVDSQGNAYVTGYTTSADFPLAHPIPKAFAGQEVDYQHPKAFVAEINAPGSALLFSTYLGGNDQDIGLRIAVDSSDRIYVAGRTSSTDFPIVNPIQSVSGGAGFVARIVPGPPAVEIVPAAVSNGWPIKKYVFNDSRTVVFAGGEFLNYADGIVYSSRDRFFRIVVVGEAVPGTDGSLFGGFLTLAGIRQTMSYSQRGASPVLTLLN